jgi:DNA-binding transcriptional ArsR family regulator
VSRDRCDLLCLDLERAEALRQDRLSVEIAAEAAAKAKALADPTRLTLAVVLTRAGEECVCDLSWVMERSENLVSHHLKVLKQAGLVRSRREGKMVLYSTTEIGARLVKAVAPTALAER